jgi:hypothetical protein
MALDEKTWSWRQEPEVGGAIWGNKEEFKPYKVAAG